MIYFSGQIIFFYLVSYLKYVHSINNTKKKCWRAFQIPTKLVFKLGRFAPRLFSHFLYVAPSGGSHFFVKVQSGKNFDHFLIERPPLVAWLHPNQHYLWRLTMNRDLELPEILQYMHSTISGNSFWFWMLHFMILRYCGVRYDSYLFPSIKKATN